MARSDWRIGGRARMRGSSAGSGLGAKPGSPSRATASRTARTAASVTSLRYRLDFFAARIGNAALAQTGPASNSPSA
jgi:hypothetical protein